MRKKERVPFRVGVGASLWGVAGGVVTVWVNAGKRRQKRIQGPHNHQAAEQCGARGERCIMGRIQVGTYRPGML